jgi:hypothetical protein
MVVEYSIHSLDVAPKRFSIAFTLAEIVAGKDLTNDATETTGG